MKMRMFRLLAIGLALLLAGCGSNVPTDSASGDGSSVTESTAERSTTATATRTEVSTGVKPSSSTQAATSTTATQATVDEEQPATSSSRRTVATTKRTVKTTNPEFATDVKFPVTPPMSIIQSASRVRNVPISQGTKISSDYTVASGYDPNYAYTHHPGLTVFKGRLYYSYSHGLEFEDAPGQQAVVCSMSLDNFGYWSNPVVVVPTRMVNGYRSYVIPGYLHVIGDRMYLYYMEKVYGASAYDANGNFISTKGHHPQPVIAAFYRVVSTTDGINWSDPVDVGFAANESPRQSLTGTWFAGAGNMLLTATKSERDCLSWKHVGMTQEQVKASYARGGIIQLTEASWFQTDDYVIHQMLRCHDGYVWMSESYDNGKTFTEAYPTNFTSDTTMANFGRLPDGRFYAVCNPNVHSGRYPLALYISEDGYNFDKAYILRDEQYAPKKYNWTKIGAYAYPEVLIHGDYMYVAHSQYKEIMSLSRIKLSDI